MEKDLNDLNNRFEDFVTENQKNIDELKQEIQSIKEELIALKKQTSRINISNEQIKGSIGTTMQNLGNIVGKYGKLG